MAFQTNRIQIDGSLNVDGSIYQFNQLFEPGGGGGISWSGSTANGIATYGSSSTVVAEPNLTFDGSILEFDSATNKTIRMKNITSYDPTPQSLSILGAKGKGQSVYGTTTYGAGLYSTTIFNSYEGGDVRVQAGDGADGDARTVSPYALPYYMSNGGAGGDLLLYAGDGGIGIGSGVNPSQNGAIGNVNIKGGVITLDSDAITIGNKLFHSGDADTYMEYENNVIRFYAGSSYYDKLAVGATTVVINEDGRDFDFRVEGDTDTNLLFANAGIDRVGIGLADCSAKLHIVGGEGATTYTNAIIALGFSTTGAYPHFIHTRHNSGAGLNNAIDFYTCNSAAGGRFPQDASHGLTINNGRVGIKTTTPSYDLHVIGDIYATGDVTAYSDVKGKENIKIINENIDVLSEFDNINPIIFSYKDNPIRGARYGFSAQEVYEIFPYAANKNDDEYSIRLAPLIALNTSAIKQLKSRVETLEEKVEFLMKHLS